MLNIIDVSEAQGYRARGNAIVWSDVVRWVGDDGERVDAAILKATEGNGYVDKAFVENSAGALAVGLLLGWYHFAHPDNVHANDPVEEAQHFVATVKTAGFVAGKHILALDIEEARQIAKGAPFGTWVLAFCDEVERQSGQCCVIYTGGPFFDDESGEIDDAMQARLARHPLWLAAYVTNPDKFIPKAWRATGRFLHQDTGDVAPLGKKVLHVAGIGRGVANVDHDEYDGTREDLDAFVAGLIDDPTPIPGTLPSPPANLALQIARQEEIAREADERANATTDPQTPVALGSKPPPDST